MDKEMMAKINEALKANGRRELSMDEADKVVGGCVLDFGGFRVVNMDDAYYLCYTFLPAMRDAGISVDVICSMLTEASRRAGGPSKDYENKYRAAGSDGLFNWLGQLFDAGGNRH